MPRGKRHKRPEPLRAIPSCQLVPGCHLLALAPVEVAGQKGYACGPHGASLRSQQRMAAMEERTDRLLGEANGMVEPQKGPVLLG